MTNLPFLFICFAPAEFVTFHYCLGIVQHGNLYFIDPRGTIAKSTLQIFNELKNSKVINDFYISNTRLQHDDGGIVNCGPICVELINLFSKIPFLLKHKLSELKFRELTQHEVAFKQFELWYVENTVLALQKSSNELYQEYIKQIRRVQNNTYELRHAAIDEAAVTNTHEYSLLIVDDENSGLCRATCVRFFHKKWLHRHDFRNLHNSSNNHLDNSLETKQITEELQTDEEKSTSNCYCCYWVLHPGKLGLSLGFLGGVTGLSASIGYIESKHYDISNWQSSVSIVVCTMGLAIVGYFLGAALHNRNRNDIENNSNNEKIPLLNS
jgi:hypothetical protein